MIIRFVNNFQSLIDFIREVSVKKNILLLIGYCLNRRNPAPASPHPPFPSNWQNRILIMFLNPGDEWNKLVVIHFRRYIFFRRLFDPL